MQVEEALQSVAVIGAAGKMGRGIAALLTQEMARLKIKYPEKTYRLVLIDSDAKRFGELRRYLKQQLIKEAERQIVALRQAYASQEDLVSNREIIDAFIEESMAALVLDDDLQAASRANLIFEAIVEDVQTKVELFKKLRQQATQNPIYLTNTSSIPIHLLNQEADLKGRIIGFHFYNPPPVQKLLELILPENVDPEAEKLAGELAKRLRKLIIPSRDVAGFVSNGYFMREIAVADQLLQRLNQKLPLHAAIYAINRVTQEWLLRPMGIFQLVDYVGIDVCQRIATVMNRYLPQVDVQTQLLQRLIQVNLKGGVTAEGEQHPGIFSYVKGTPEAVYSLQEEGYRLFKEPWRTEIDGWLGDPPLPKLNWKTLSRSPNKTEEIEQALRALNAQRSPGDALALEYLTALYEIAKLLVAEGTARSLEDVSQVLQLGFSHLYGPDAAFFSSLQTEEVL